MPSFATAVVTEDSADSVRVALNARFILVAGSPSDTVYALKGRVPDGIDVVLHSDLVITISGTMDRARVDSRAIQSSAIAQHLQNYFHVNGEQLGVRIASRIFVDDDDDGKVKITLSPTRPVLERCSPFVRLSAIELVYACKKPPTPHAYALPQSGSLGDQGDSLLPEDSLSLLAQHSVLQTQLRTPFLPMGSYHWLLRSIASSTSSLCSIWLKNIHSYSVLGANGSTQKSRCQGR
ncbi:hypothetical protein L227DRAFT_36804 [Lentinus tigrinus ALCF2SS1-6]|uniref:Uncharacterized protein n=1 Tax=Lentinus tigrinus ALCF2SS1-6 TaxID=1328759 RepID=A0A5C2SH04_9APHY|nr:hypothetical protein L227DRAFT_36804 [Lentinus tigrinus ALCF2SS1-6]